MRILMIPDFYPPFAGGIERHVQMLGHELVDRGHRVEVAAIATEGREHTIDDDGGVIVHRLPTTLGRLPGAYAESSRPFAPPAPDPELTLGIGRMIRAFRPDVVHGHAWSVHSYLPLHPGAAAPLVVTLHEYGLVCPKKSLVYRDGTDCSGPGLAKCLGCASAHYGPVRGVPVVMAEFVAGPLLRRAAARFIAVSAAVALRNRLGSLPHDVIPNFLPEPAPLAADGFEPWTDQLPAGPFLLFVGALGGHKGIHTLLEAYARLADPPPLVCIGHRWADTPETLPPGVVLLEDWPHGAVRVAWSRCLFGLVPSTWPEPFGIVALEAMEAGRPVVASRIGGLGDVVRDDETGILVPPGDPYALRGAMARLLGDEALRRRLGDGARAAVAAYHADSVVPRIERAYQRALAPREAPAAATRGDAS